MRWRLAQLCILALCIPAKIVAAPGTPNFSGTYKLISMKGAFHFTKGTIETLVVSQDATSVSVTRTVNGKAEANTYPLDGSEGPYISPGGRKGSCKGELEGKNLLLESIVSSQPSAESQTVFLRTRERWELSGDSKKLTIRVEIDSPSAGSEMNSAVFGGPGFEIYARQ